MLTILPSYYLSCSNIPLKAEEILLTIQGTGEQSILNKEYNYPPDEIEINGERSTFNNNRENKYVFNMNNSQNTVKIFYNNSPESFKNMFKDLSSIINIYFSNFNSISNLNDMTNMFYNCTNLKTVILNGLKTSKVTSMENMFYMCKGLESLDLSNLETSSLLSMKGMFHNCENLTFVDFSNFDTSSVTDMTKMFHSCSKIQYIDISDFKTNYTIMVDMFASCAELKNIKFPETNKIGCKDISYMFHNCKKLEYLDLSSFDTSLCTNMEYLFDNCVTLTSVKLSRFNTTLVKSFSNMFAYCANLELLNLETFITTSATNMENMFRGCQKLMFMNFKYFSFNSGANMNNILGGITQIITICCNENVAYSVVNNDCQNKCFTNSSKLISSLKKCVDDCSREDTYKYEYNGKCFSGGCPEGTISTTSNEFICINKLFCQKYYNINKTQCLNEIPSNYYILDENERIIDKCHDNCKTCSMAGTDDNNNCLTCNDNDFFDNGNCIPNCKFGNFTDNSGNRICTCNSDIKCKECSDESLALGLCISCNINSDYYPKINDTLNSNSFVNCYNEIEEYYLDNNKKYFYPCYTTCKKCSDKGDSINHNCNECKNNYDFIESSTKPNNCYEICPFYYYFNSNNEYQCTPTNECPSEQSKLIISRKKCIESCSDDNLYKKEYKNQCFIECPNNTIYENGICIDEPEVTAKDSLVETEKIDEKIDESIITDSFEKNQNISGNWSAENFFLGLYIANETNVLSKDDIVKQIRNDIISKNLDPLLSKIMEEKEDKYVKEDNVLYQITTSDNQNNNKYNNISSIKLGDCERILKRKDGLYENETLIILKIDYSLDGLLIPIIYYEVYNPRNKSKLDLSHCEKSTINYNIPVSINEDNLFKHDPNSEYYNDECNTYTTENGTDIILNDRKEEFVDNNMSLCENSCEYTGYDSKNKKALCECGIKYKEIILSEVDYDTNLLANDFTMDDNSLNMITMKCYDTLFNKEGLLKNIGSYFLMTIIIIHFLSIIFFYKCSYPFLYDNIIKIVNEKKVKRKSINNINEIQKKNIYRSNQKKCSTKKRSKVYKMTQKNENLKINRLKSIANPIRNNNRKKKI